MCECCTKVSIYQDKINKRVFVFSSCLICCYNKALITWFLFVKNITNRINQLEISKNYGENTSFDQDEILANHKSFMSSVNIPINDTLTTLYWIPNFHENSYKERYIAGSSTCSTKELPITTD